MDLMNMVGIAKHVNGVKYVLVAIDNDKMSYWSSNWYYLEHQNQTWSEQIEVRNFLAQISMSWLFKK